MDKNDLTEADFNKAIAALRKANVKGPYVILNGKVIADD